MSVSNSRPTLVLYTAYACPCCMALLCFTNVIFCSVKLAYYAGGALKPADLQLPMQVCRLVTICNVDEQTWCTERSDRWSVRCCCANAMSDIGVYSDISQICLSIQQATSLTPPRSGFGVITSCVMWLKAFIQSSQCSCRVHSARMAL